MRGSPRGGARARAADRGHAGPDRVLFESAARSGLASRFGGPRSRHERASATIAAHGKGAACRAFIAACDVRGGVLTCERCDFRADGDANECWSIGSNRDADASRAKSKLRCALPDFECCEAQFKSAGTISQTVGPTALTQIKDAKPCGRIIECRHYLWCPQREPSFALRRTHAHTARLPGAPPSHAAGSIAMRSPNLCNSSETAFRCSPRPSGHFHTARPQ